MAGSRIEVAPGCFVRSWDERLPAPPEALAALERRLGPLPLDELAFLARADGVDGEIEDEEGRGAHVFLLGSAEVGQEDESGTGRDWRWDTLLSSRCLLIGTYLADGYIAIEARPEGGWDFIDVRTDSQSEPVIGVETRYPSLAALLGDLKIRG